MVINAMVGPASMFIFLFIGLLVLIFPLLALISILKNEFEGSNKLVWVLVVLFLPILGSILYFLMGRSQKL